MSPDPSDRRNKETERQEKEEASLKILIDDIMNKGKLSPEKEKDYWLSTLEFKDPLIEEKFQVEAQQSVLWLGKVVILEVMFFNLVDICFEIHDTVVLN